MFSKDDFFVWQHLTEDGHFSGMKFMATVTIIFAAASLISVAVITCGYSLRRNPHR